MQENNCGVGLSYFTRAAIRAQQAALEARLAMELMPLPQYLGPNAQVRLRLDWDDGAVVEK